SWLPKDRAEWVVKPVRNSLFKGDDRIVCDVNVFGADLGAALRYVAHPYSGCFTYQLGPVLRIERMHLQLGEANEEARAIEASFIVRMVADHMADVLA